MPDIRIYRDSYGTFWLRKWSNRGTRLPVGIVCTVGRSIFRSAQDNRLQEMIAGGMNIARINLSHYPLDAEGRPDGRRLRNLVDIIKTLRRCSNCLRTPVNIMLDLKGPEIRIAAIAVPDISCLHSRAAVEIEVGATLTLFPQDFRGSLLIVQPQPFFVTDASSLDGRTPTAMEIDAGGRHLTLAVEAASLNSAGALDLRVTGIRSDGLTLSTATVPEGATLDLIYSRGTAEMRVRRILAAALRLSKGRSLTLTADPIAEPVGAEPILYLDYDGDLAKDISRHNAEDPIYLDNGKVSLDLVVDPKLDPQRPRVRVVDGERVDLRKGLNLFGNVRRSAGGAVSGVDRAYLAAILQHPDFKDECPVDSIAVSFTRSCCDLGQVSQYVKQMRPADHERIKLIAKIESPHCFLPAMSGNPDRFDQRAAPSYEEYERILRSELCWGIMVARGDLGVEIRPERVPGIQRDLVDRANAAGKAVVVATQMLLSMMHSKRPSRADVADIHEAVLDGADVVMLSEETAAGQYPLEALAATREIVKEAVAVLMRDDNRRAFLAKLERIAWKAPPEIMELLGKPMVDICDASGSRVIFSYALTGGTAVGIPKYRPQRPIVAITSHEATARGLLFYFRIYPLWIVKEPSRDGQDRDPASPDFPRDLTKYREFLSGIIAAERAGNAFRLGRLSEIENGEIVFGLLGIDPGASRRSDRAIVVFRISGLEPPAGVGSDAGTPATAPAPDVGCSPGRDCVRRAECAGALARGPQR